jgi:hypothetical protein
MLCLTGKDLHIDNDENVEESFRDDIDISHIDEGVGIVKVPPFLKNYSNKAEKVEAFNLMRRKTLNLANKLSEENKKEDNKDHSG